MPFPLLLGLAATVPLNYFRDSAAQGCAAILNDCKVFKMKETENHLISVSVVCEAQDGLIQTFPEEAHFYWADPETATEDNHHG